MIRLWSINRWLRFTGFRLVVAGDLNDHTSATHIGLMWFGLPNSKGWKRIEPKDSGYAPGEKERIESDVKRMDDAFGKVGTERSGP